MFEDSIEYFSTVLNVLNMYNTYIIQWLFDERFKVGGFATCHMVVTVAASEAAMQIISSPFYVSASMCLWLELSHLYLEQLKQKLREGGEEGVVRLVAHWCYLWMP